MSRLPVTLVISIDTETDAWDAAREPAATSNLRRLPALRDRLAGLGLRPTWLATWRVATDPWGAGLLGELHATGSAEVGAHLHPWTTPPVEEPDSPPHTMLCNLPRPLQEAKLRRLTDALAAACGGDRPTSFRAGRWGFDGTTAAAAWACGYSVDSSVTPWFSWAHFHGPDFAGAPERVVRLAVDGAPALSPTPAGALVEVPVTCGYSRRPFAASHAAWELLGRRPLRWARARGALSRSGALRPLMLSPETATAADMLRLARHALAAGAQVLNVAFHSQSLVPGLSPFVRTARDLDSFHARLEGFVERLGADHDLRPATLTEAARRHA